MIIGHARNLAYLENVLAHGAIAHAYLFHGPDAIGKKTVARAIARLLLCEAEKKSLGGCQELVESACPSCRMIDAHTHPDFIAFGFATPLVAEESKKELGIKNIHELQRRLSQMSWRGGWKVVIIDDAEKLSPEAQSALLKSLEEPREKTVIFLVTSMLGGVLSTIRSRSIAIGFSRVAERDLAPLLKDRGERERSEFLRLVDGRPGALMRALDDAVFFKELRASHEAFVSIMKSDLPDQFAFAERMSRDEAGERAFFVFLMYYLRDDLLRRLSSKDNASVAKLQILLTSARESLDLFDRTSVNRRLLLDRMFVELATV